MIKLIKPKKEANRIYRVWIMTDQMMSSSHLNYYITLLLY